MNLINSIIVGLKEIWSHKFRSILTMLGIILGVASLVAMAALVKGMENGLKAALIEIGGVEKVRVEEQDIPPNQLHLSDQAVGNTVNDLFALQQSAPLLSMIQPEMRMRGIVTRGGKTFQVNFIGTWPNAIPMNQHAIEHGRMFNEIDEENAASVCVVGTLVRDEIFGSPEKAGREIVPTNQIININGMPFTIIGMFKHYESDADRKLREAEKEKPQPQDTGPKRSRGWGSRGSGMGGFVYRMKNATVYIPLETMWLKMRTSNGTNNITPDLRLSGINIKVRSVDVLDPALQQARNVLLTTHRGIEDFSFRTQEDWADQINDAIRNAQLSGGIIAAISLLVGGIGIMNIMLASITERVREIGIRKAIGASTMSVFVQIIVESSVIAVIGGVAGLVASMALVQLLVILSPTENTPVITLEALSVAFLASVLVGVLAGLIPAFKAAKLNPIQALRYD